MFCLSLLLTTIIAGAREIETSSTCEALHWNFSCIVHNSCACSWHPIHLIPCWPLAYAQDKFVPLVTKYGENIYRLLACLAYVPLSRLQSSPYADLASPSLHLELEPMFATEYCASLGMSRQVPLRVVCNIGGGGALARIEKGRKVMRERKSEWSQTDELPVCASTCFPIRRNTHFLHRLKYRYLQRIGITQYSPAPYRRSRQQTQTHR